MSIACHVGLAARCAVCLLVLMAVPHAAQAQGADAGPTKAERAAARDAYDKGTKAFEHGDYAESLDDFVKANAMIPSVQALYWIARAQDELGKRDAAIEAYEAITARADFSKLSADKAATVNTRLATLKAAAAPPAAPPPAPAEPAPPAELPPAPEAPPAAAAMPLPPSSNQPPPVAASDDELLPKRNTAELGVTVGTLFVSGSNNLAADERQRAHFKAPVWEGGLRAAFFPEKIFGVEAEWEHGFSHVKPSASVLGGSASFDAVRGHLLGQLPTSRLVPFALLGAGLLHEKSKATGADTDFVVEMGVGLKVMATKLLVPRLDVRGNLTQKKGGGFTDGVAFHPEILLGLSFTLGR